MGECFPTLLANDAEALDRAHDQIKDFVISSVTREYEEVNIERGVDELLADLEVQMAAEAQDKKFNPENEPNPVDHTAAELKRASLAKAKLAHVEELKAMLAKEQEEIGELNAKQVAKMQTFQQLYQKTESLRKLGVDRALEAFETIPIEEMYADIRSSTANLR